MSDDLKPEFQHFLKLTYIYVNLVNLHIEFYKVRNSLARNI